MPEKLYVTDIPAAVEQIIYNVRKGLLKTFTDEVALVHMPKAIDFQFAVILRKDDLQRQEISSRDATTTTTTSGTSTETEQRSAATSVTDETEVMNFIRTGGEGSGTAGGEGGTETTNQTETSSRSGGEGGTESTSQVETSSRSGGEGGTESTTQVESSTRSGGEGGTSTENMIDSSVESTIVSGGQIEQEAQGGGTVATVSYDFFTDADN